MMLKPLSIISLAVIKMIKLSVNLLSSAIILLQRINDFQVSSLSELIYSRIALVDAENTFLFANNCGWAEENNNIPYLTERGKELLNLYKKDLINELNRNMLSDYIFKTMPVWSSRIPFGRSETVIFMTKDERACFFEAGLLSENPNTVIINWWDSIADNIRGFSQKEKETLGRIGEQNTIEYEKERTGANPKWMSIDSNLAGYDIISKISFDNNEKLLIEVKCSTLPISSAFFHVSSNEWDVAINSKAYLFYLWCLDNGKKMLAKLTPDEVKLNIPINNLEGKWESTKIPFSFYSDSFLEIQ